LLHLVPCSECGQNALNVIDSGLFSRSPILGITSDGAIGCAQTEVDGDYKLGVYFRSCGHRVCGDSPFADECADEVLTEWARSAGEARAVLPFACSICGSAELRQV